MTILMISLVICLLLIGAAVFLIATRQPPRQKGELLRLSETYATAIMGVLALALAFFILYMKYTDPTLGGEGQVSYLYTGGFAVLCALLGSGVLLYTFLHKVIAYEDRIVSVSMFGDTRAMYWKDITEVKVARLSNKALFISKDGQMAVGGEPRTYKKFVHIARKKIRNVVGSEIFEKLLNRFMF